MSTDQRHSFNLADIKVAIRDYELATGVNCYLLDKSGQRIGDRTCYQCSDTCSFVKRFDPAGNCVRDYPGSCRPALDGEHVYRYHCPYGLLNIAVPVLPDDETIYFASSGPLLLEPPNEYFIRQFMESNELITAHYDDVKHLLNGVPLVDDRYLQALGNTLQKLIAPFLGPTVKDFWQKYDTLAILAKDLEKQTQKSLYPEYKRQAYVMEKEIELLAKGGDEKCGLKEKALHLAMTVFIGSIYKYRSYRECKHRAARFFLSLLQIGQRRDMNLELIFGKGYEVILRLLAAEDYAALNQAVYGAADRFQSSFFLENGYKMNDAVLQAMEYIRENYMDITLAAVAKAVSLHPNYLSDLFKKQTGQSYSEYLNKVRIDASKQYLRESMPLAQIAQQVGFADQSYFIKVFKNYEGISPSKWRNLT